MCRSSVVANTTNSFGAFANPQSVGVESVELTNCSAESHPPMDDVERARLATAEEQWIAKYRDAISQINAPAPRGKKIRTAFDELWRMVRSVFSRNGDPHAPTSGGRAPISNRAEDNDQRKIQPFPLSRHSPTRAAEGTDRPANNGLTA